MKLSDLAKAMDKPQNDKMGWVDFPIEADPKELTKWALRTIEPGDLDGKKGVYLKTHVTVLYGVNEGVKATGIAQAIKDFKPFDVTLGKISHFPNPEWDVLKLSLEKSEDLLKLHEAIRDGVDTTLTYKNYSPHVTVAYLVPGKGKKYDGIDHFLTGQVVTVSNVFYHPTKGIAVNLRLKD